MIDDIVEMVLKEARGRVKHDYPYAIQEVMMDVNKGVLDVLDVLRQEERRKEEKESAQRYISSFMPDNTERRKRGDENKG